MSISATDIALPAVVDVTVSGDALSVGLSDGRTLSVPLTWFPRLLNASTQERSTWRLIGRGTGIHWPLIEEDISIESLIAGRASAESAKSLDRWLAGRGK